MKTFQAPEVRRRHIAEAKRWNTRMAKAGGALERRRCHDEAMRRIYLALGHVPSTPGPLL